MTPRSPCAWARALNKNAKGGRNSQVRLPKLTIKENCDNGIVLTCNVDNNEYVKNFDWTLNGAYFGQRVVETQRGPLFRVEGSHVTLSCKVRGYEGTPKQNFHWSIYRPASPSVEIHIVSTADPHFTYALYRHRVRMQDIYIERTSTDSVLLHITKLQVHDQGEYECYTPNTDSVYYGAYSDKTILTGGTGHYSSTSNGVAFLTL
ncbi:UNVERIFIED_CONTAM: hypothetical protein FKN15_033966 [Acipenser sinensis]